MKRKLPNVSKHLHIFICFFPKILFRILPWRYSWRSQDVSRLTRRKRFNFRSYSYVLKIRKIHRSNRVQLDIQTSVSPKLEAWFISRNVQLETSNSWKKILLMNFSDSHLHQKVEVLKFQGRLMSLDAFFWTRLYGYIQSRIHLSRSQSEILHLSVESRFLFLLPWSLNPNVDCQDFPVNNDKNS